MQKNCKKIAKKLRKICKIFAEFLQLHILQNVLQFRPREESVSMTLICLSKCDMPMYSKSSHSVISQ